MTDFDSPWKEALDAYLEPCLAFYFPQAHADVDWARGYETLDKELQQIAPAGESGRRIVDKLVKVWLKSGKESWLLIHIKVQTWHDPDLPERVFVYNYRTYDRYNRTVASLVILADERPGWRPEGYGYAALGCKMGITFPVVKLLDFAPAAEALGRHDNPFATVTLAHLKTLETRKDPGERLAWKSRLVRGLFECGFGAEDVRKLFRFIDWIMDLPEPLEDLFWQEVRQLQEERHMPFIGTPERMGRKAGLREGRLEAIKLGLKVRFGDEGLQLMPQVNSVESNEVLLKVMEAIEAGATLDEVRVALES